MRGYFRDCKFSEKAKPKRNLTIPRVTDTNIAVRKRSTTQAMQLREVGSRDVDEAAAVIFFVFQSAQNGLVVQRDRNPWKSY